MNWEKEHAFFEAALFVYKWKETDILLKHNGQYYNFSRVPGIQFCGDVAGLQANYRRLVELMRVKRITAD